ncbi:hypothetical protein MHU86_20643 [Fragilaria crotonensis]|nr:hypothetical protein MHU86_20643 [Fragilaria crotonensis]
MAARVVNEIHQGGNFQERLDHVPRDEDGALEGAIPLSQVTPNDVLCGRRFHAHHGNRFFGRRCAFYLRDYMQAPRFHQTVIRNMIVNEVLITGGRFLANCRSDRNYFTDINRNNHELHRMIRQRMRYLRASLRPAIAVHDGNRLLSMFELDVNAFILHVNGTSWSPSIPRSFRSRSHF